MMWVAQAVSAEVYHILEKEPEGRVHSVFNQSYNLIFGDRLVHIGALDNGLAPFGIGLDQTVSQMLTRKMSVGQPVAWNAHHQTLAFTAGDVLSLQQATTYNHSLAYFPFNHSTLQKNFAYIADKLFDEKWQTGIVQTDEEKKVILRDMLSSKPAGEHPVLKEFASLLALAQGEGKIEAVPVFNYWIGRGPGLTPSGDDILTGLCAMLTVLKGTKLSLTEHLDSYLFQYGSQRTTQVGVEYLTYAAKHQYHSDLVQLCKSLLQADQHQILIALEDMQKMGHTSGTDTLIGMLLGMKMVINNP